MAILNYKQVIIQCKDKHGDKFDYTHLKDDYVNCYSKVRIRCIKHDHTYNIRVSAHKNGQNGCHQCKSESISNSKSRSQFDVIKAFKRIHGERYDYSLVEYTGTGKKVKIKCNEHGIFEQISFDHESGSGCPSCGYSSFKGVYNEKYFKKNPKYKKLNGVLYIAILKNDSEEFVKIGITKYNSGKERLETIKHYKEYTILHEHRDTLYNVYKLETILHEKLEKFKYKPKHRFSGHTECFINLGDKIQLIKNKLNSIK